MSILISVMILMVEFFSAYLNKSDVSCSDHVYLQPMTKAARQDK